MDCLSSERIILFHEKALKKFGDLEGVYKPEYPPPPLILGIMSNNFSVRKVTLTMNLLQNIQELPKIEKMVIMEFLWKDLFEENDELESPEWHKNALTETEERVEYGREEMIGWAEAKRRLRETSNIKHQTSNKHQTSDRIMRPAGFSPPVRPCS